MVGARISCDNRRVVASTSRMALRIVAVCVALSGCATSPGPARETAPAPETRVGAAAGAPVAAPAVASPPVPAAPARAAEPGDPRVVIGEMLERGPVHVQLDTRRPGTTVPARYETDARLIVELDRADGLTLDATGIRGTGRIAGTKHRVTIPWTAIYGTWPAANAEETVWWSSAYPEDLVEYAVTTATVQASREPKRTVVERMVKTRGTLIYLDARRPGVVVPPEHRHDPELVLRIGLDLVPPIPDLAFDARGITGTLQFQGKPFRVEVPWTALYAAIIEGYGRGVHWAEKP